MTSATEVLSAPASVVGLRLQPYAGAHYQLRAVHLKVYIPFSQ